MVCYTLFLKSTDSKVTDFDFAYLYDLKLMCVSLVDAVASLGFDCISSAGLLQRVLNGCFESMV